MNWVSFDIFDTCISRLCGDAVYLFYILAHRILGDDAPSSYCAEFVQERLRAEQKARRNTTKEEITLNDIYAVADFSFYCTTTKADILAMELEIERALWQPVKPTLQLIEKARQQGSQILFISDMYLPQSFIEEALRDLGIFKEKDKIYVSADIGITKQSGKLFDYVRSDCGIDVRCWQHYGDNKHSDYEVPKHLGVGAHWLHYDYKVVEPYYLKQMDLGEYPVASVLAGLTRSMRLATDTEVGTFAYSLSAPLFVSWTLTILKDAAQRGIRRLCFLARDGYIPYRIAKQYAAQFPTIECSYVCVSRKSLYLPGEPELSYETIREVLQNTIGQCVAYALDVWNINNELHIPDALSSAVLSNDTIPAILQELQQIDLLGQLLSLQNKSKKAALLYFLQEHLTEPNTAIVDIRGTRTSHRRINDLLVLNGYAPVFAYYLEVFANRCTIEAGDYRAEIYDEVLPPKVRMLFTSHPAMIEQVYAQTPFPRTIGYEMQDGKSIPVFDEQPNTDRKQVQDYIDSIRLFADCFRVVGLTNYADKVMELSLLALLNIYRNPPYEILHYLSQVSISETDIDKQFYIRTYSVRDWLRVFFCHKTLSRTMWFEGDVRYNMPTISTGYIRFYYKYRTWVRYLRSLIR